MPKAWRYSRIPSMHGAMPPSSEYGGLRRARLVRIEYSRFCACAEGLDVHVSTTAPGEAREIAKVANRHA